MRAIGPWRAFAAAACLVLASPPGLAGQEGEPRPAVADTLAVSDTLGVYRAEPLSVTVARDDRALGLLPLTVSVVGGDLLRDAERGVSLEEGLAGVPGLFVQNRRNFALEDRVAVRGAGSRAQFGVRGVRVLADGIPLTFADGQSSLGNLDLASLGRVEVLRGPASTLHGNAAGGVLSFTTRAAPDRPLAAEARVMGAEHGTLQTRLMAGGRAGGTGYLVSASRLDTDGWREHARAEVVRLHATASRPALGGELRLLASFFRTPFARNPSSLDAETARERPRSVRPFVVAQGAGKEVSQGQIGAAFTRPLGTEAALRTVAWGAVRDLWNPIPGRIVGLDRAAGGVRTEAWGTLRAGRVPLRWTAGADVELQRDDRVERENAGVPEGETRPEEGALLLDQRESVTGFGPFLQGSAELGAWTVTAGTRLDTYRFRARTAFPAGQPGTSARTLLRASPSVGISRALSGEVLAYATLSTAFQTPTANELSNRPDGEGGFNPELEAERIRSLEVGLRGVAAGGGIGWSAAAYRARVRGAILPFQGPGEETFFRNAGEVERTGLELEATWRPAGAVRGRLAYTWLRSRFLRFETDEGDFAGRAEPGVPEHAVTAGVRARAPLGLWAEVRGRWVDAYPVDDANLAFNPSYRVADLRLWLPAGGRATLEPFVGIDNLFDERYNGSVVPNAFGGNYFEPSPGRELYGGLALRTPGF